MEQCFPYPTVWPLPYGTIIRNDHNPEFNYAIERNQIQCWPIKLDWWDQVTLNALHNGWLGHQAGTLTAWLSHDPGGSNILPALFGVRRNVHLGYVGNSWTFHRVDLPREFIHCSDIDFWIYPDRTYYFNVKNISNISDGYYLRFHYRNRCEEFKI